MNRWKYPNDGHRFTSAAEAQAEGAAEQAKSSKLAELAQQRRAKQAEVLLTQPVNYQPLTADGDPVEAQLRAELNEHRARQQALVERERAEIEAKVQAEQKAQEDAARVIELQAQLAERHLEQYVTKHSDKVERERIANATLARGVVGRTIDKDGLVKLYAEALRAAEASQRDIDEAVWRFGSEMPTQMVIPGEEFKYENIVAQRQRSSGVETRFPKPTYPVEVLGRLIEEPNLSLDERRWRIGVTFALTGHLLGVTQFVNSGAASQHITG